MSTPSGLTLADGTPLILSTADIIARTSLGAADLTKVTDLAATDLVPINRSGVDVASSGAAIVAAAVAGVRATVQDVVTLPVITSLASGEYLLALPASGPALISRASLAALLGSTSSSSSGGSTTAAATTFSVAVSPSSGAVGAATNMTVTPGSGGWPSGVTVTPAATSISGSFSPASATPSGTSTATFAFTPSAAATGTLNASAPGMTSNGAATYTATAASTGNSPGSGTALTMTSPTYADRGDGSGLQMLTGGSGSAALTLPSAYVVKVKVATSTVKGSYEYTPFIQIVDSAGDAAGMLRQNNQFLPFTKIAGNAGNNAQYSNDYQDGGVHDMCMQIDPSAITVFHNTASNNDGVRNFNGGFSAAGQRTLTIRLPPDERGVFDVRIYSGSMSSLGTLLYEWQLSDSGVGS